MLCSVCVIFKLLCGCFLFTVFVFQGRAQADDDNDLLAPLKILAISEDESESCNADEYKAYPTTGSCYKYHPEKLSWEQASKVCDSEGGYLIILNNNYEHDLIVNMTSAFNENLFHIGVKKQNGTWQSVRGDSMRDIYNKRIYKLGYDCAWMIKSVDFKYGSNCDQKKPFVCEKRNFGPPIQESTLPQLRLYKYHEEQVSWKEAELRCSSEGRTLASVKETNEKLEMGETNLPLLYSGIHVGDSSVEGGFYHRYTSQESYCGSVWPIFELGDFPCDSSPGYPFICEKNMNNI